jgi:hypothetical protein
LDHDGASVIDSLLQRLSERSSPEQYNSSDGSVPLTPATDEFSASPTEMTANSSVLVIEATELQKLRAELQEARNEVSRMNQEMHSQNVARSTMEHLSQSSEADYNYTGDVTEQTLAQLQSKFNASLRTNNGWGSEPIRPSFNSNTSFGSQYQTQSRSSNAQTGFRNNAKGFLNEPTHFPLDQSFGGSGMNAGVGNYTNNGMGNTFNAGFGGLSNPPTRCNSAFDQTYNQYTVPSMHTSAYPAPIGTAGDNRLSADANEFNVVTGMGPSPWNSQVWNHGFLFSRQLY